MKYFACCLSLMLWHQHHNSSQVLLDLDDRFGVFFPHSFFNYSMLAGTAMLPCDHEVVLRHLDQCNIIIVDPQFCPTFYGTLHPAPMQLLATTLYNIMLRNSEVGILLILPQFLQAVALQAMPYLQMLEYRVRTSLMGGNESFRIFTNFSLLRIPSPQEAGYLLCLECNDWMAFDKTHCKLCNKCHSQGFRPWRLACRNMELQTVPRAE